MKRRMSVAMSCLAIVLLSAPDLAARGGGMRGGGAGMRGGAGGMRGGMARPGYGGGPRPGYGGGARPSYGGGFPSSRGYSAPNRGFSGSQRPMSSPGSFARPGVGPRPLPGTRPAGSALPNVGPRPGSQPGAGTRPGTQPGFGGRPGTGIAGASPRPGMDRPTSGQLNDFLGLPGHVNSPGRFPSSSIRPGMDTRPANLPGVAQRPGVAERPGTGAIPPIAQRPNAGQRPVLPDRPGLGPQGQGFERPSNLPANRYDGIRDRWQNRPDLPFDRDDWQHWAGRGWWYGSWYGYPAYWAWAPATYASVGNWMSSGWSEPVVYDYGTNLTYQDDNVYQGDQLVASAEDYAEQANEIAASVPQDVQKDSVEWLPLGVFAIAEEGAKDTGMVMQLAVSKEGIIAGTYHNDTSGNSRPVEGMVDRESQRAAWKFADDKQKDVVFETGIANLTQDESKCLVHFGPDKTQTWTMIRLPAPEQSG